MTILGDDDDVDVVTQTLEYLSQSELGALVLERQLLALWGAMVLLLLFPYR